jgi:hypothetical protein
VWWITSCWVTVPAGVVGGTLDRNSERGIVEGRIESLTWQSQAGCSRIASPTTSVSVFVEMNWCTNLLAVQSNHDI